MLLKKRPITRAFVATPSGGRRPGEKTAHQRRARTGTESASRTTEGTTQTVSLSRSACHVSSRSIVRTASQTNTPTIRAPATIRARFTASEELFGAGRRRRAADHAIDDVERPVQRLLVHACEIAAEDPDRDELDSAEEEDGDQ